MTIMTVQQKVKAIEALQVSLTKVNEGQFTARGCSEYKETYDCVVSTWYETINMLFPQVSTHDIVLMLHSGFGYGADTSIDEFIEYVKTL